MTGLGYLGADIVLDKNRGPMMLEINARPGLAIQIANGLGLKTRLKEIDESYPTGLSAEERVDFVLNN
jgi:glutathione synthase/RimK-type ligase-like ATP-grasp enzyme